MSFTSAAAGRLSIVRDPLRLLLFALTVLTVSRVHQHYPQLMRLRPALLLVIASAAYAYLNPRFLTRVNVLRLWPMRLIAVLGVLACCSAVFGISLGRTASFILDVYVKVLVYAFLVAVSIRHVRDLFTFVWAYVVGCAILAFFSLFVFGITRSGNSDFARLSNLYMYDANDLGVIMMVGLPLTLLLLLSTRGSRRALLLLILLGISATIARSGSRGGFLGFIVVGAAALILVNSVSLTRRTSIMVAAVMALMVGAPRGYWKQMSTILEPKDDYNYSTLDGRKALAQRGIGYMAKYPVFGLGMNNFSRAECTISPKLSRLDRTGPIRCMPPHNSYVQAGAELGIPGLLIWVSLVAGVIVTLIRLRGRLPQSWRRGTETERFIYGATSFFPLAMIGFAVTSFFVSFAWVEPIYIIAAFTTGLLVVIRDQGQQRTGTSTSTIPSVSLFERGATGWRVAQSAQRFAASRAPEQPCL
jgi:O-antigen ligase